MSRWIAIPAVLVALAWMFALGAQAGKARAWDELKAQIHQDCAPRKAA